MDLDSVELDSIIVLLSYYSVTEICGVDDYSDISVCVCPCVSSHVCLVFVFSAGRVVAEHL